MYAARLKQYLEILLADQQVSFEYIPRVLQLSGNPLEGTSSAEQSLVDAYRAVHQVLDSHAVSPSFSPQQLFYRAAFLLDAIEEFDSREIGRVLDAASQNINITVENGRKDFHAKSPASVLIIEDEKIVAIDLQHIVASLGFKTVAIAHSQAEALSKAKSIRPDLLLVDLNLGSGGSGLVAVEEITRWHAVTPVFVTAYPEKLLTRKRPHPTYLISKPFLPETVKGLVLLAAARRRPNLASEGFSLTYFDRDEVAQNTGQQVRKVNAAISEPVVIRNREEVALYTVQLIAELERAAAFDKAKQHNQPPPAMWLDDEPYLKELRVVVGSLREVAAAMASKEPSTASVERTVIDFRKHANTFLENYAATLGKGAAYGTLCIVVALLSATGWGGQAITKVVSLIHPTK